MNFAVCIIVFVKGKYISILKIVLRYCVILREPLRILIKYKTIDTPKIDNILKIHFDVSTKL